MKERYHHGKIEEYVIPYTIGLTILVCIILMFISKTYAISFLIGSATSILCFKMTIKTVDKIIWNPYLGAKKAYIINNISKLSIYLIVLVIAGLSTKFNGDKQIHLEIIPVAIGFFSIKFMIYFKYFVVDKIFKIKNYDDSLKGPIFPLKEDEEGEEDD